MGANAVAFVKALGLTKVDVLGFSIGRFVAQEITLQAPDLVRRLILFRPPSKSWTPLISSFGSGKVSYENSASSIHG
jgi:pimeloyl-ACP methyl ester carboxylesterase